jgi:hypothetical protein
MNYQNHANEKLRVYCKFYQMGHCKFGDSCRFQHVSGQLKSMNKRMICRNYGLLGYCKWGNNCKFVHDKQALGRDEFGFTSSDSTLLWENGYLPWQIESRIALDIIKGHYD